MKARPLSVTILAAYLLIVFSISLVGSIIGAASSAAPYTPIQWVILAVPKLLALLAGIALWRMLRVGAWLLLAGILSGWALLLLMGLSPFPTASVAILVTVVFVSASIGVVVTNWSKLQPADAREVSDGAVA